MIQPVSKRIAQKKIISDARTLKDSPNTALLRLAQTGSVSIEQPVKSAESLPVDAATRNICKFNVFH